MSNANSITQPNPSGLYPLPTDSSSQESQVATSSGSVVGTQSVVPTQFAGMVLNAQGQSVPAGSDGDLPPLPDVGGDRGSTRDSQGAVASWLTMPPGALSQALGILADAAGNNMLTMSKIRQEAAKNEYDAQSQSADQLKAQVQGERESAWTKFAGSMVGAGVSVLAAGGGAMKNVNITSMKGAAFAAGLSSLAQPIMSITDNTTNLIDKTQGGQYQADQAKIAKAYLDMLVSLFKSQDDGFNSGVQNAQKSLQNVWDLTRQVNDQNSQAIIGAGGNV